MMEPTKMAMADAFGAISYFLPRGRTQPLAHGNEKAHSSQRMQKAGRPEI